MGDDFLTALRLLADGVPLPPLPGSPTLPVFRDDDLEPAIARALARIGRRHPALTRGVEVSMDPRVSEDAYAEVAPWRPSEVNVNPQLAAILGSDLQAEGLMRHELDHVDRNRMLQRAMGPDFRLPKFLMEESADRVAEQYIDQEIQRDPSRRREAQPTTVTTEIPWWVAYPYRPR